MSNFRSRTIQVSNAVWEGLKAIADTDGLSCPDEVADIQLGKWLEAEHDLGWLIARNRSDREKRLADYTARLNKP